MRDADANETSGELGSAFGGILVLSLCVLFWRYFVCFVCDSVRVWLGVVVVVGCEELGWVLLGATYGSLCDGNMWGESGRVGCNRSRV